MYRQREALLVQMEGQGQVKSPRREAWGLSPKAAGAQELCVGQKPGQSGGLGGLPRYVHNPWTQTLRPWERKWLQQGPWLWGWRG